MNHIFGPVPSRRLGLSLGVDVVPYKRCSYDCIYCQLGRTTCRTTERERFADPGAVLREIEQTLTQQSRPDYITLSGSGEPTLYRGLDEIIEGVRNMTDIPVVVLTNGSLLWREDVVRDIEDADIVIPSLDAGNGDMFRRVNRPDSSLVFETVVEGIRTFSRTSKSRVWLEVFLIKGLTSAEREVRAIADLAREISPERVDINTVKRPPAEKNTRSLSSREMEKLSALFSVPVKIICDFSLPEREQTVVATREDILELLKRRPCTVEDIADSLGLHRNEVLKYTDELMDSGHIITKEQDNSLFFSARVGIP